MKETTYKLIYQRKKENKDQKTFKNLDMKLLYLRERSKEVVKKGERTESEDRYNLYLSRTVSNLPSKKEKNNY